MTWQELDIVFIHSFSYHTAHSLEDSLVRAMTRKLVNKNDIKLLPCNNLYLLPPTFRTAKMFYLKLVKKKIESSISC